MSHDPIIDALFDGEKFEREAPREFAGSDEYGKGDWRNAVITEAIAQTGNQYGRSVTIKVNLKGDEGAMPFTFFVNAPAKPQANGHDVSEKDNKRYYAQLNNLKSIVHASGTFVPGVDEKGKLIKDWPESLTDFSTDEAYDKLVSLFTAMVGKTIGLRVKYRTYSKKDADGNAIPGTEKTAKDVYGLDPKAAA
jgi:hypothetical protein